MKIFIKLLFALLPLAATAQNNLVTTGGGTFTVSQNPPSTYYLGRTYNKSNFTNMADFGTNSVGGSASGGHIVTTLDGAGTFTAPLELADTVRVSHFKMVVKAHLTTTQSTSTFGISIGLLSVNANALTSHAMFYNMSSTNNGHVQFFNQDNGSTWTQDWTTTQTTPVPNSTNDAVILTYERINNILHFGVYNATTNSASWDTVFTVAQNSTTIFMPNTAVPTIWANGGHLQIDSLAIVKNEPMNPDVMFVGDSKGIFSASSGFLTTYPAICSYFLGKTVTAQGFGDLTANMLSGWHEIKTLMPRAVVFEGGSNDLRFNGSLNTAAITALMDSCQAYGIIFIPLSPMFESAQDLSGQLSFFAGLPNEIYLWDISKRPGFLFTDGIHLSALAPPWIARRIRESNLLPGPTNRNEYYQSGFTSF